MVESKNDLQVALMTALWMSDMLSAGFAELAAAFARVDNAAAIRMIGTLETKFRDDVAKQRRGLQARGSGTQPMNAMQNYLDDAISEARAAIEASTKPH